MFKHKKFECRCVKHIDYIKLKPPTFRGEKIIVNCAYRKITPHICCKCGLLKLFPERNWRIFLSDGDKYMVSVSKIKLGEYIGSADYWRRLSDNCSTRTYLMLKVKNFLRRV